MATAQFSCNYIDLNSIGFYNGISATLTTNSEIPAGAIINSFSMSFSVLKTGSSVSSNKNIVLYSCSATLGSTSLINKSNLNDNIGTLYSGNDIGTCSWSTEVNNVTINNAASTMNISFNGEIKNIGSSTSQMNSGITVNIDYTIPYTKAPTTVPQSGNLSNYPVFGEPQNPSGGILNISGTTVESGSFNYSSPSDSDITISSSKPCYLIYSQSQSESDNFTVISSYVSNSGSFVPANYGIIGGTKNYYRILAYSDQHGGYIKSSGVGYTFDKVNTPPIINSVLYSPKGALESGGEISVKINASDAEQDNLTYFIDGQSLPGGEGTVTLYPGENKIDVSDGKVTASTFITLDKIETLSINVEDKVEFLADTFFVSDGLGLVKNIDKLTPMALLGTTEINNIEFNINYSFGENYDDLTLGTENYGSGYSFENIDVGNLTPIIAENGYWYQFNVSCEYIDSYGVIQQANKILGPFKYPKTINKLESSYFNLYNENFGIGNEFVPSKIFNNKGYLVITMPENGTENYAKIDKIKVYIEYSQTENFKNNYVLLEDYNIVDNNQYILNFDSIIPYNFYFKIKYEFVDVLDQNTFYESNKIYQRTFLPYFDNKNAILNFTKTIPINELLDNQYLTLKIPTVHTITSKEGTDSELIMEIANNKLNFEILNNNQKVYTSLTLNRNNFTYNEEDKMLHVIISPTELKNMLSSIFDLSTNNSYEAKIYLNITDDFSNSITNYFIIDTLDSKNNETIIFSFGKKPVMNTNGLYNLKVKVPYNEEKIYELQNNPNESEYLNIINPNDILYITFSPAQDVNGNDNGENHGDIVGYKIKIQQKDNLNFNNNIDDYKTLIDIKFNDDNLVFNNNEGLYTYSYVVPEREYANFAKIAISAYDSTQLESNYYYLDNILVLSRITKSDASIISYKRNKTETNFANYNLSLKINDIGGNKFKNSSIRYSDYPNLERIVNSTINNSRDIKFTLYYRSENEDNFVEYNKSLNYKINNSEIIYNNYDNNISYSDILNSVINFNSIDFTDTSITNDVKGYFKIKIEVQTGFDNNGNKVYSISETPIFIINTKTPVMYLNKNSMGINTTNLDNDKVLKIATVEQEKNIFQIESFDEQSSIIFDLVSKMINGITISDE